MSKPQTITELVSRIKDDLESNFTSQVVVGEISNLSKAASGHVYFTLSDSESSLSCALFKFDAIKNSFVNKIKNGDKIQAFGSISVYAKRGTFQLITKQIAPVGKGDLKEEFEKLKLKLQKEGLFDEEHKKSIPSFPRKVALITAKQGAALQDFLNLTKNKALHYNITIIPTLVQGENAHVDIMRSIDKAESLDDLELIILMRGGGSLEDLWCFNNEELARKIFQTGIPIISAVGHQTDFTLCDFVADLRVETPSAAAEVLISKQNKIKETLRGLAKNLILHLFQKTSEYKTIIEQANPINLLRIIKSKHQRIVSGFKSLNFSKVAIRSVDLSDYYLQLDEVQNRMNLILSNKTQSLNQSLDRNLGLLKALGPENVLKRGYSILRENNKVIDSFKSYKKIDINKKLEISFHDGTGIVSKEK